MVETNSVSGLKIEGPLFGFSDGCSIKKSTRAKSHDEWILYEPRFCLVYHSHCLGLYTPFFEIYWYRKSKKLKIEIKIGNCWHDPIHDLKHLGFLGFIKHIRKYW